MARSTPSTAPKATRRARLRQVWTVFQMTRRVDPSVIWWMLLAFLLTLGVGELFVLLLHVPVWLALPMFAVSGVLLALIVMARRAERAAFAQAAGQPGATALALQNLRRGWTVDEQPAAVDPRTQDLVFRAVGRPGVVLVTEGPLPRAARLADQHAKHLRRILGEGVPVTVYHGGDGEGQVPLMKLSRALTRAKPVLTKGQVDEVNKRLRALGGVKVPVPKGIDPTRVRPDRKAFRGR
jgi:hypothetical protein